MTFIQQALSDIRRGENIDVFVTVTVAIVLATLNITGVANLSITSLTLAVLALLTIVLLGNRYRVEQVHRDVTTASDNLLKTAQSLSEQSFRAVTSENFFWRERISLESYLAQARTIYVAGITLNRTLRDYSAVFERRLKSGAQIRFIVIDPDSTAPRQAVLRSKGVLYDSFYNDSIRPTLNRIYSLSATSNATIELGLLPYVPSFGIILIDPDEPHGRIIVEIYQHRTTEPLSPTFELTPQRDARWYNSFKDQFNVLWESCSERKATGADIQKISVLPTATKLEKS